MTELQNVKDYIQRNGLANRRPPHKSDRDDMTGLGSFASMCGADALGGQTIRFARRTDSGEWCDRQEWRGSVESFLLQDGISREGSWQADVGNGGPPGEPWVYWDEDRQSWCMGRKA